MTMESTAVSGRSTGTGQGSARSAGARERGLCTFWLGDRHFGLDVGLVGEIVNVEEPVPVPLSPSAVRGLFNLRGTPVALLDIGEVLALGLAPAGPRTTALVVRREELVVAFLIDRMEAVLPPDRGAVTLPAANDHPAVDHFVADEERRGSVVTVLSPAYLLERLDAIRFLEEVD